MSGIDFIKQLDEMVDHVEKQALTLRDRFAMAALTGILVQSNTFESIDYTFHDAAEDAYRWADAMLEARKK